VSTLEFIVPGDLATRTGGYAYDRRVIAGLRELGWTVRVHSLGGDFPQPTAAARAAAARRFARLPDGALVLVDGLAYGALPEVAAEEARRLRLVALVHHPLAAESGLAPAARAHLRATERAALAAARLVVVTGRGTAAELGDYDVAAARIVVVVPGTDVAAPAQGSGRSAPRLLCVATLTPRKGHLTLLDALAPLTSSAWTLSCVGSTGRDPGHAALVRQRLRACGLADRVELHGELDDVAVDRAWDGADLFVSAAHYEGYGMALAEAVARGLPVVATRVGAAPDLVPAQAGALVPPGDADALRAAVAPLLADPARRAAAAAAARAAAARLPRWPDSCARLARALDAVA
jgi:glycosyltransferase involved in cell wall biosynthesis